jgi:DNA-binding IclR family transcriptional regulator
MNNTLVKGLCLLEVLARRGEPMGVSELASAAAMPKSGVHRLLQALVDERYVEQSSSGRYRVSIKLWEVASAALPGFDLRRHAEGVMHALVDETGESVHLSVLDHHDVVYVHKLEAATNPVRAYSQIGGRVPAHCVATGKAMMAFRGPRWLAIAAEHLHIGTGGASRRTPARYLHRTHSRCGTDAVHDVRQRVAACAPVERDEPLGRRRDGGRAGLCAASSGRAGACGRVGRFNQMERSLIAIPRPYHRLRLHSFHNEPL